MSPEELVSVIDFQYITDAITPGEAVEMLRDLAPSRERRIAQVRESGYPAYTTSVGWLGYSDEKIRRLCREAIADGWRHFKQKVGSNLAEDRRRAAIIRQEIGEDGILMMDANQRWDVGTAIEHMNGLTEFNPYWIEEPTSPDDILGHAAIARALHPVKVATGEHAQNRVIFKQLMMANAIGICQIDSCRLGGVNEVLSVLLMAAKYGIPVCPHAGGVGLCEYVQHLAIFDYVCVSGSMENRLIEYVDHLHEHFVDPVVVENARYRVPELPGYSITMHEASLNEYSYPDGRAWHE
jgi:L-fuconate dehydratase